MDTLLSIFNSDDKKQEENVEEKKGINQGNNNKAELLLNKAHLNIKNIDEDKLKCECLIAISSTYFNFENFALSNEILKQAIEVANGITDDDSRDYSIIDISKEFSKRGSFVEAISFSKEIKSELKSRILGTKQQQFQVLILVRQICM
jgi:hypothetical protein